MEKKKKRRWPVIVIVFIVIMAVACSGSGDDEIKEAAAAKGDSSVSSGQTAASEAAGGAEEAAPDVTIEETVLLEEGGVRVTAAGLGESWSGPEVKLLLENESDRTVLVTAKEVSVNGYMMPTAFLYEEVAAGKKANAGISLSNSGLRRSGVDIIAELECYIEVKDAETWDLLYASQLINISTSAAGYEQPVDDSGDVLYDSNGIKVVCKGLKQDVIWDGTIVFYLENNSNSSIVVLAEDVSVNGFMQDSGLWSSLRGGTKLVDGMYLLDLSDLELESIDEIENIEFVLRIVNESNWSDIATSDVISLTFE